MALANSMIIFVTLLNTLLLLAVLVGVLALEFWLSRRKSPVPGLILPVLSLVLSLLLVLGNVAFQSMTSTGGTLVTVNEETGEVVQQEVVTSSEPVDVNFISLAMLLLVGNIPTLALLGTYFIGRDKLRREKLLEKMNIQDL